MEYNKAQLEAINSADRHILCLAAAGSGKTSVLVGRISHLVDTGVDPASILVLTFTNAAAQEMSERYCKMQSGNTKPTFGTFHSFCYRLIVRDPTIRTSLGYDAAPTLASDAQLKKIRTSCKMMLGIKLSEEKLNGDPKFLNAKDRFQYDLFQKRFDQELKKAGLITFDIMCYAVAKLFSENALPSIKWKSAYKYVFVDEFQDTDKKQWDFVRSFTDSSIFVVGDPRQAIYRFRGADSEIIKRLAEDDSWTTIKLEENYRSTEQICAAANKTHDVVWGDSKYNIKLHANKSGDKVEHRNYEMLPESDIVLKLIAGAADGDSIAILCRTNREVEAMCGILGKYNIPFTSKQETDNSQQIVRAAIDPEFAIEWMSSQLKQEDYAEYIRQAAIIPDITTDRTVFLRTVGQKIRDLTLKVEGVASILDTDSPAKDKFELILRLLDKDPATKCDVQTDEDIIKFFTESKFVKNVKGSIYVGTIHSSKGLEYDRVHLMGVGSYSFRIGNLDEDNLNLYYVGITRAREHLTIWEGSVLN